MGVSLNQQRKSKICEHGLVRTSVQCRAYFFASLDSGDNTKKGINCMVYGSILLSPFVEQPVPGVEDIKGAPLAQCARSATIWASSRTGDPYFVILGASLLPLA